MFLPSAVLHKPACLVLVLLLTPLECIFSRSVLKITASGSGWAWAAVLHVCFPAASESWQQRYETRATLHEFPQTQMCSLHLGALTASSCLALPQRRRHQQNPEPLTILYLLSLKNIVFHNLG